MVINDIGKKTIRFLCFSLSASLPAHRIYFTYKSNFNYEHTYYIHILCARNFSALPSMQFTKAKNEHDLFQLSCKIETGFPSPAGDHLEKALHLEDLIIHRPTSTFYVRAEGNAMKASGIHDGDLLIVDRSLNARNGSIIIVSLDEEVIIRQLAKKGNRTFLISGDMKYAPIPIGKETNWMIWGVATHLIHQFRNLHIEETTI